MMKCDSVTTASVGKEADVRDGLSASTVLWNTRELAELRPNSQPVNSFYGAQVVSTRVNVLVPQHSAPVQLDVLEALYDPPSGNLMEEALFCKGCHERERTDRNHARWPSSGGAADLAEGLSHRLARARTAGAARLHTLPHAHESCVRRRNSGSSCCASFARPWAAPITEIASLDELPVGSSRLFEYPGGNACLLVRFLENRIRRPLDGNCTHLSCPVIPDQPVDAGTVHAMKVLSTCVAVAPWPDRRDAPCRR